MALTYPVEGGASRYPIGEGSDAHLARGDGWGEAIDIPGPPSGVPALAVAVADCTVTVAIRDEHASRCGRQVDVAWTADGHDWIGRYCHLAAVWVDAGHTLTAGAPVGVVGMTGLAFGVHLHFVLFRDGVRVRPEDYLFEEAVMTDEARAEIAAVASQLRTVAVRNERVVAAVASIGAGEPWQYVDGLALRDAEEFAALADRLEALAGL